MIVPVKFKEGYPLPLFAFERYPDERRTNSFWTEFKKSFEAVGVLLIDRSIQEILNSIDELKSNETLTDEYNIDEETASEIINKIKENYKDFLNKASEDKKIIKENTKNQHNIRNKTKYCVFSSDGSEENQLEFFGSSPLSIQSKDTQYLIRRSRPDDKNKTAYENMDKFFYYPLQAGDRVDIIDRYLINYKAYEKRNRKNLLIDGLLNFFDYTSDIQTPNQVSNIEQINLFAAFSSDENVQDDTNYHFNVINEVYEQLSRIKRSNLESITITLTLITDTFFQQDMHDRFIFINNYGFQIGGGMTIFGGKNATIGKTSIISRAKKSAVKPIINRYLNQKTTEGGKMPYLCYEVYPELKKQDKKEIW